MSSISREMNSFILAKATIKHVFPSFVCDILAGDFICHVGGSCFSAQYTHELPYQE
jgi:hypothetical protein